MKVIFTIDILYVREAYVFFIVFALIWLHPRTLLLHQLRVVPTV